MTYSNQNGGWSLPGIFRRKRGNYALIPDNNNTNTNLTQQPGNTYTGKTLSENELKKQYNLARTQELRQLLGNNNVRYTNFNNVKNLIRNEQSKKERNEEYARRSQYVTCGGIKQKIKELDQHANRDNATLSGFIRAQKDVLNEYLDICKNVDNNNKIITVGELEDKLYNAQLAYQ